jgi:hypothetical protein
VQALHGAKWRKHCLGHPGAAQIQISQLREADELIQPRTADACAFKVQDAQVRESGQRGERGIRDDGAAQFRFDNIGCVFLKLRELRIAELCGDIDRLENQSIGCFAGNRQ